MNANLLNTVRILVASQGTTVLLDSRRVDENLPVFAGKEASVERKLFIQALAAGLPAELQSCPDQSTRLECKKRIARKLSAGQGIPAPLVKEVFDLIEEILCTAVSGRGSAVPYISAASISVQDSHPAEKTGLGKKIALGIAAAAAVLIFGGFLLVRSSIDTGTLLEKGRELYNNGHYKGAITILNRVIKKDPAFAEAYFYRGLSFLGNGDDNNAIINFNYIIENGADYYLAYYYRAYAFLRKGLYESALWDAGNFAEYQPGNYLSHWLMGDCYFNIEDYQNAISEYTRAIEIEPDRTVYTARGRVYLLAGEFDLAINDLTVVLENDPANSQAGELLALAREGKEAIDAKQDEFLRNLIMSALYGGPEAVEALTYNWAIEELQEGLFGD
jgi:tetratricopeptide (TPR) repeat protein